MDYEAHWRALYGAMRTALDADGLTDVDVLHIFAGDATPLVESATPPFVAYRQDVERTLGTTGEGSLKVMRSNWLMSSYAVDLADSLAAVSSLVTALTDAKITTTDGYSTTNIQPLGVQSLYEADSELYATHFRLEWERST